MLSYLIVGSGYRSEYFARIAAAHPELFRALYLCRSEEKAEKMRRETGTEATVSLEQALAFRPDFIIVAVDRAHVADVAEEWVLRGYPVVTETPVGDTPEKLERLWELSERGAKIVCCEQYDRQPVLAQGLLAVDRGKIGKPQSAYISLMHDYHGARLIRRALQIPPDETYVMHGHRQETVVTETDSRYGAILDGRTAKAYRDVVHGCEYFTLVFTTGTIT